MSDLYKLGQSPKGNIQNIGEEIRLDINLQRNPFLDYGHVNGAITYQGTGIQDVLVKILDNNYNPLYHVLTDENGNYSFDAIIPGSEYKLVLTKTGYLTKEVTNFSIIEGQTLVINSELTPDPAAPLSTITAHIVDTDNKPIENLIATLYEIVDQTENPIAVTTTNEYGQLVFTNVPLGNYIAKGTKQEYEPGSIELQITQPGSILNITGIFEPSATESLGTINGIIYDENNNPVPNAIVVLYKVTGDPENPTLTAIKYTRTSNNGAYLFGDIPQGEYLVKSNKEN